jgi:hypothetical protein
MSWQRVDVMTEISAISAISAVENAIGRLCRAHEQRSIDFGTFLGSCQLERFVKFGSVDA